MDHGQDQGEGHNREQDQDQHFPCGSSAFRNIFARARQASGS